MQRLYQAGNRLEAQLLSDMLQGQRIGNCILGDYLQGAVGDLPADIWPSVWVIEDADLPRARELLAAFHADNRARADARSWVCRGCGELLDGSFDLCWHCGNPRAAV